MPQPFTIKFYTVIYEARDGSGLEFRHPADESPSRQRVIFTNPDRALIFPDDFVMAADSAKPEAV